MKRIIKIICALVIIVGGIGVYKNFIPIKQTIVSSPYKLKLDQNKFVSKEAISWKLDNGLTVYYYFDDQVPIIDGSLLIAGGSLFDPLDKIGLANAFGSQIREGGTESFAPDELDKHLDYLGAKIESNFGTDYGSISFRTLTDDIDEVFQTFSEVVLKPRFDPQRLKLWQGIASDSIERRKDDPDTMARIIFSGIVYGDNNVYGKTSTKQSINTITQNDLINFHKQFVLPQNAYLAISGSISVDKIKDLVGKYFNSWGEQQELSSTQMKLPDIKSNYKPGVYVLNRDFVQANILIGHLGPARVTEDMIAIHVYNKIFGLSGFDSILFNEIRTKAGLAYSVRGGLIGAAKQGVFQISLGTKSENAITAVKKIIEILNTYPEFSLESITSAKKSLAQAFVFKFENAKELPLRQATLDLLEFPKDYDRNYLKNLDAVTPADVSNVRKHWIKNDSIYIVIVGKVSISDIKQQLGEKFNYYEVDFDEYAKIH
ncbi:MAG: insulinase family protein [Deltaproteobacteria bacterium]|jgi:zinc protease|nr:insulinase family protein [Deltaproteobacteria bacterium]